MTDKLEIATERLVLRPPAPGDEDAIFRGIADFDIVRMLSRAPWPYGAGDAARFVASVAQRNPDRERPLAIIHRDDGLIGGCGFHASEDEPFPEIGYWLARRHWGHGFASEAASAALKWAREGWGKRAVRASHFVENAASGRVLVKCGALYTGVVEPEHCEARGETVLARKMIWLA